MIVELEQVLNTKNIAEITGIDEDRIFRALKEKTFLYLNIEDRKNMKDVLDLISNKVNSLGTNERKKDGY